MTETPFSQAQADALVEQLCDEIQARAETDNPPLADNFSSEFRQQLAVTLAGSQYVYHQFLVRSEYLQALAEADDVLPPLSQYMERLLAAQAAIVPPSSDATINETSVTRAQKIIDAFDQYLRSHRTQAMVAIIWAELNCLAPLEQITAHLTALAEASIQVAMDFHYGLLAPQLGEPVGAESGQVQPMLVLGMGKLGAWELNLSSDIDLIFAYPENGETQPLPGSSLRKTVSNQEFFQRLGQNVIKSLDAQTADGFVFRTDMRLRPYGQSGPLAANFGFLEEYYQNQGREWERYAMIKARVVAGSSVANIDEAFKQASSEELMALLRPFSYRRYVDFSVINALRDMKALISREVKLRRKTEDVKLGRGGIREVEFIVQAFQLVRGGRDFALQERRVLKVLPILQELGILADTTVTQLSDSYRFLRRLEHALQAWQDRQTQALPVDAGQQARLAFVMGFDSWQSCYQHLESVRVIVEQEFQAVVGDSERHQVEVPELPLALWTGITQASLSEEEQQEICAGLTLRPAQSILTQLAEFSQSRVIRGLPTKLQEQLDRLVAMVLHEISEMDWQADAWPDLPDLTDAELLARALPLLEVIVRRSAYLLLLQENPTILPHLLRLFAASVWIAERITAHPALLEELLDVTSLHSVPEPDQLRSELEQVLIGIPAEDLEQQMDALRYFRRAHGLRVAACEVSGALPLMKVSDYLTWVAEQITRQVLEIAWDDMVSKYGWPQDSQGMRDDKGFIIVAYGKAGGLEMAHGSDLDLVFIHDCESTGVTNGSKPIDVQTFYTRLGQKVIHILNTRTNAGRLYEVDMRLRPSGNSGLLVTSLNAFAKYQKEQAWTWEHQALLRARPVAGSARLIESFNALRQSILCVPRDRQKLRQEVVDMRNKMRVHLASKPKAERFDLKQDRGGIVDIEFMVQYTALAWAETYPDIVRYTDNIRILDALAEAGLMSKEQIEQMASAYKIYRATGHRLALQDHSAELPGEALAQYRDQITALWQTTMLDDA